MAEEEIKEIFSKNLRDILEKKTKTQSELAKYIGVSTASVAYWCTGKKMPRMDKIQSICNWLGIEKSDLLEINTGEKGSYYIDPKTAKMAQELKENKELKILFDAARDASPEDLQTVHSMLLALKRKENHEN